MNSDVINSDVINSEVVTPAWKFAALSVVGSRHLKEGRSCEDSSHALWDEALQTLVLVAADGAGSADNAAIGSSFVVEAVMSLVPVLLKELDDLVTTEQLEQLLLNLARTTREQLEEKVRRDNQSEAVNHDMLQTYATTLLVALQTPDYLAALQIGDGFIIITTRQPDMVKLFEARKGQYANQTCFLTSLESFDELVTSGHVNVTVRSSRDVCSIALITDGLENVAMTMKDGGTPHPPFFLALLKRLSEIEAAMFTKDIASYLLENEKLNEKTDDDKTLVLALNLNQLPEFDPNTYPATLMISITKPRSDAKGEVEPRVITLSES
jgi:serine/threonine protein phosphatase PrpC